MSGVYNLPAFYPDELWCSALARYHLRSGNRTLSATLYELGAAKDGNDGRQNNTPYSTRIMMQYYASRKDEKGFFDALSHQTLDPFLLRYTPVKAKLLSMRNIWEKKSKPRKLLYETEGHSQSQSISLAYCPECFREDMKNYGEAYWHRIHQIPTSPICIKHGCRLINRRQTGRSLKILPEAGMQQSDRDETPISKCEMEYAQYTKMALESPFSLHREPCCDAIMRRLIEMQYITFGRRGNITLKTTASHALCAAIREKFGIQFADIFFDKIVKGSRGKFHDMFISNSCYRTECFLIVAMTLGVPPKNVFEQNNPHALYGEAGAMLSRMAESGYAWDKKEVVKRLNVRPEQLSIMARAMNLPPFWIVEHPRGELAKSYFLRIALTNHEKQRMFSRIKALGVQSTNEYIRYCIRKEMESADK